MFTPIETSIGALLLHQATSILLHNNGGILGASEYMRRLVSRPTIGAAAFFAGMAASFPLLQAVVPELLTVYSHQPTTLGSALVTVAMGLLVGWGTKVRIPYLIVSEPWNNTYPRRQHTDAPPGTCSVVCPG